MTILHPYHLPSFLKKQPENATSDQPLDLSLSTLEKRVMQQFNDQVPIEQISQKLETSAPAIHKIIKKKSSYTSINARKLKSGAFHLKPYQPICNHYRGGPSPTTIEKLKVLLHRRSINNL